MGKLEGRHIVVTGAASGMGRAIAELFAAEGAALALLDGVALKRLGETEDVSRAALFFSTEDSAFTTAALLRVDGGFAWR
jgi:NAD(P)-dependent dehydrogenase (short-subunit alcohol dehydrogenase family)